MMPRSFNLFRLVSLLGIAAAIALAVSAYRAGLLTSQDKMVNFVSGLGIFGPAAFFLIQVIQVVIPILPGGVSCLAGVLLFGPVYGFALNYLGICTGSLAIFMITRSYGRPALEKMFSQALIAKYDKWTAGDRFGKLFAAAIFFPFAPDDFLCALAGTTKMSIRRFIMIIFLGKIVSILLYSIFLETGWKMLMEV